MSADTNDRSSVVALTGVSKVYPHPIRPVHALREVPLFRRRRVGVMFHPVVSGATSFPQSPRRLARAKSEFSAFGFV